MTTAETIALELRDASDEQIERAVAHAEPMVLRGLLYQLTGDEEVAATRVTVDPSGFQTFMMVAGEADVALLRSKALDFLRALRDSGAGPVDIGPEERLRRSIPLVLGEALDDAEYEYCREELGLDPWARASTWRAHTGEFSVIVIGAGFGGLDVAVMLKRAGIPYTVIEKDSGVGGTWWETRYPGARVDTPSRAYTHIFGAKFPYSSPFCGAAENRRYFDWVADTFEVREDIVFDTEVRALRWDEGACEWEVSIAGPAGERVLRANAVVTAVGFLNRPRVPEIEGMTDFRGRSWHTSRWPVDADVADKRVAVIGTGCTGYQLIPELALQTEHVVAFQRTPQWLFGVEGYLAPFAEEVPWLDRNLPYYTNFMRLRMFGTGKAFMRMTEVDPSFDDPHAVSARNKAVREAALAFLERKVADPDLRARMTPPHPPWSARAVVVDTDYNVLDAIQRDDVTLVTSGVRRITTTGIEDGDGVHHEVDLIVYATGFHASEYLFPMTVTGVGGQTLEELWKVGGARAHRFCMYPGFPNLWSVYGPNTNGVLGPATFHDFVARYAIECMERLIVGGGRAIEPRRDAYDRFNAEVDARNARKVWSDPRAHNYYWTEHGRSAVMCPFNSPEIFTLLRHPAFDELEIR
ncbi:NAD(P)/FAD-dependent oxidoreductase [Solirubrobacter ginsenosidimutans]|uniref:NAD(P)/FAD-dependent oxidoreductase n=1 Tax=Solirubrobacter ginsenosidimutans TaxID=490573 RepID=A0A9X3N280_9ACTN|nr:NAD(P)/FAD-dependent oxidoreductase [Solirubrobacter ginsenosidimutans]MDA0165322.1 NAD(P)/FAD-dependent oxidoreductase [Solirubrobacter ginsenosidimutans]